MFDVFRRAQPFDELRTGERSYRSVDAVGDRVLPALRAGLALILQKIFYC